MYPVGDDAGDLIFHAARATIHFMFDGTFSLIVLRLSEYTEQAI